MKHIKLYEQFINEGKYNTVKKVVSKLGNFTSPKDLAKFVKDNFFDVTGTEDMDSGDADDKIADLVGFYKLDPMEWEEAWAEVTESLNESVYLQGAEEFVKLYEQFINEKVSYGEKPYVAIQNWEFAKKGEIWMSTKKDETAKVEDVPDKYEYDYIFLDLADPTYHAQGEINPEYFDEVFVEIGPDNPKHEKYMKKLKKWGMDTIGNKFQIAEYILDSDDDEEDIEDKVADLGFEVYGVTADTPKLAVKKEEGIVGKETEILKNKIWVVQKTKDRFYVVFTDEYENEYESEELTALLKKKKFIK